MSHQDQFTQQHFPLLAVQCGTYLYSINLASNFDNALPSKHSVMGDITYDLYIKILVNTEVHSCSSFCEHKT